MTEQIEHDHGLVELSQDMLELVSGGAGALIDGNGRPAG
jgi:hypothetical protein